MMVIKNWLQKHFWNGYSTFEKLFLAFMLALQVAVFVIYPDSPLNIIAGLAGVVSVVMCAKGRTMFYFIGFIQTITYLVLAWQNRFYGEVLENLFYFVTMIWGIFVWKRNSVQNEDGTEEVAAKKFTPLQWVLSVSGTVLLTIVVGFLLDKMGSAQAYTDAATNVMAIFAQLLMVRRYREQWVWWLVIDLFCIKLWFVAGNWSMVAMYIAWTANAIYGWYNWSKLNKMQTA
ncbi:MAG: nicotinamide mononucleotide transporter [Clostridia bacterium]|nr:nicotinamide mononucleotide transporter [Clostridia bacterium]